MALGPCHVRRRGWIPQHEHAAAALASHEDFKGLTARLDQTPAPSVTEMELLLGLQLGVTRGTAARDGLLYMRSELTGVAPPHKQLFAPSGDERGAMAAMRHRMRALCRDGPGAAAVPTSYARYQAAWKPPSASDRGTPHEHGVVRGLGPLRDMLIQDLWAIICRRVPAAAPMQRSEPVSGGKQAQDQAQDQAHAAWQRSTAASVVVGRDRLMRSLVAWARGGEFVAPRTAAEAERDAMEARRRARWGKSVATIASPSSTALLLGPEGSGKSAFLAALAEEVAQQPGVLVIAHYTQATERATDPANALYRICAQLQAVCPPRSEPLPTDVDGLRVILPHLLRTATAETKVLIVVDGVDSFVGAGTSEQRAGSALSLLPTIDMPRVRVIAGLRSSSGTLKPADSEAGRYSRSSRTEEPGEAALVRKAITAALAARSPHALEVSLLQLETPHAESIVRARLREHGKQLAEKPGDNQLRALVSKAGAKSALYVGHRLSRHPPLPMATHLTPCRVPMPYLQRPTSGT